MQLEHTFSVPVPMEQAWEVLLDVERIAPCMPGATVESFDGETIVGRVKVKVGPIQVTYAGTAKFTEKDESARRAVIEASAKESRGTGTANAVITARMTDAGGSSTDVTVTTDLAITGKPAQFGRGVMAEVGNKILGKFADCLAATLAEDDSGDAAPAESPADAATASTATAGTSEAGSTAHTATAGAAAGIASATTGTTEAQASEASAPTASVQARPAPGPTPRPPVRLRPQQDDAIDLLDTAGLPVLKRLAPVAGALLVLLVIWRVLARRD